MMIDKVYTKSQVDNMISTFTPKQALYEFKIVPKELAQKFEVYLGAGFVLAHKYDVIDTEHPFDIEHIINMIASKKPEILLANETTFIEDTLLSDLMTKDIATES